MALQTTCESRPVIAAGAPVCFTCSCGSVDWLRRNLLVRLSPRGALTLLPLPGSGHALRLVWCGSPRRPWSTLLPAEGAAVLLWPAWATACLCTARPKGRCMGHWCQTAWQVHNHLEAFLERPHSLQKRGFQLAPFSKRVWLKVLGLAQT